MAGKGGYQAPENPAVQSGPGSMSQRTDGGPASKQAARYMAGGDYGDGGLMDIQTAAPMSATPDTLSTPMSQAQSQAVDQTIIPFNAPTQNPNEPGDATITAPQNPTDVDANFRATLAMYMPVLAFISNKSDTSQETRDVIAQLRQYL
jgi:hypothetical protein